MSTQVCKIKGYGYKFNYNETLFSFLDKDDEYDFLEVIGKDFSYYDFKSVIIIGFKGCLYYLDNPNIEKLEEVEKKYHNTLVLNGHREYAPEQTFTCLFIASKYVGGVEND